MDIEGEERMYPNNIQENGHRRKRSVCTRMTFGKMDIGGRVLVLQHIANFLCHAIKSDTIRTGDMPFVRIMLPRTENQHLT